jgi:hypothetical protein
MSPSQPDEASLVFRRRGRACRLGFLARRILAPMVLREGNGRIELIGSLAPRAAEVSVLRSGVDLA